MKSKKFNGLAHNIMSGGVKSMDDFLAPTEPEKKPEPEVSEKPEAQNIEKKQSKPQQKNKRPKKETKKENIESGDKIIISLHIKTSSSYKLDDLKTKMRRMAPRSAFSKINKSSIIEAAIEIVTEKLEKEGIESIFPNA